MFCTNCGTEALDSAEFCQKCGARLTVGTAQNQPEMGGRIPQAQIGKAPVEAPKKKKSKKLPIILGIIAVIAVVFAISLNGEDEIDYVATVKAYTPFADSQNLPYTCGEVFNKYISDAEWSVRKSDDTSSFVDISGTAAGTDKNLTVTIKVSENSQDADMASFSPISAVVDGRELSEEDGLTTFLLALFVAYDEKYEDMSNFDELLVQMENGSTLEETPSQGDYVSGETEIGETQFTCQYVSDPLAFYVSGETEIGETQSYDADSLGNMEVTLDSIKFFENLEEKIFSETIIYPDEGNVFLWADITVKNVGKENGSLPIGSNTVIYDGEYEFQAYRSEGDITEIPPLSAPREGALIFEVPMEVLASDKSLVLNIGNGYGSDFEGALISFVLRP